MSIDAYPLQYYHHHDHFVIPPAASKPKRKSKKKTLYFVRPHDGRPDHRRGTLGRFKDAFTGEGPDVFVTKTTRDRLMRDRPQRWQWAGHGLDEREIATKIVEPGFQWKELEPVREAPWAKRRVGEGYDFRKRRYRDVDGEMWKDARWREGATKGSWPEVYRDGGYRWWKRVA